MSGIYNGYQVRLSCKRKIRKDRRPEEDHDTGVVVWDVEVTHQEGTLLAIYDILTLVERREE
ncbi:hotdog family protein [Marinobacterium jannaschii]|uniref:hypothetical protein n=1 Tax=Marinobacterium jannaschii TaxID=64970 RepID=UPI000486E8C2|nr:hypothetical protein [Marinobacterium jannaschii]